MFDWSIDYQIFFNLCTFFWLSSRWQHSNHTFVTSSYEYQSTNPLHIPTNAVCLLSWQPSPVVMEVHALCVSQCPLRVPSPTSYAVMPLTVHYLMWAADELLMLGKIFKYLAAAASILLSIEIRHFSHNQDTTMSLICFICVPALSRVCCRQSQASNDFHHRTFYQYL